jgi:hypothetical protein
MTYFAMAVSYARKMIMKLTTGVSAIRQVFFKWYTFNIRVTNSQNFGSKILDLNDP